jgi:hypothetical protein
LSTGVNSLTLSTVFLISEFTANLVEPVGELLRLVEGVVLRHSTGADEGVLVPPFVCAVGFRPSVGGEGDDLDDDELLLLTDAELTFVGLARTFEPADALNECSELRKGFGGKS